MFSIDEFPFNKMDGGFSTADGFTEISENLAEMIKYLSNEPSVGFFYIQQHAQNAVPNIVDLRNNIVQKSHETKLHTEDMEDSITVLSSMKDCGLPLVEDMIEDIKKSLAIMSTKEPRRGLIHNPKSSFRSSWGPTSWGLTDGERKDGYFSNALKTAKQKASNLKWPPQPLEAEDRPLSNRVSNELQEVMKLSDQNESVPSQNILVQEEDFDDFKYKREVKLKQWLEGTANAKEA